MKFCHSSIYRFAGTESIGVISIADTMRNCSQPPAVLPGKLVTVTVGKNSKRNKDMKISSNSAKVASGMLAGPGGNNPPEPALYGLCPSLAKNRDRFISNVWKCTQEYLLNLVSKKSGKEVS